MFVGARIKHVKIQHIGSRPYIPKALHVILDRQRTDRTIANTQHSAPQSIGSQMNCASIRVAIACYPAFLYLILRAIICLVLPQVASNSLPSRNFSTFTALAHLLFHFPPPSVVTNTCSGNKADSAPENLCDDLFRFAAMVRGSKEPFHGHWSVVTSVYSVLLRL